MKTRIPLIRICLMVALVIAFSAGSILAVADNIRMQHQSEQYAAANIAMVSTDDFGM